MKLALTYFLRGCLALVPLGTTLYIVWAIVTATDALVGVTVPGLGLLIAVSFITLAGFALSNVLGRKLFEWFDAWLARLPVVKLLYTSIRDLLETFAGEKKTTGTPVRVRLGPDTGVFLLGLLTRDDLSPLGLPGHVAVYLPQAYNIGGQVVAVARDQVEPVETTATGMLTFMMSGGAAGLIQTKAPPAVAPSSEVFGPHGQ